MYKGKVVRPVIVRDKVAFTSIQSEDGNTLQLVLFRKHRPSEVCNRFFNLKNGEEVTVNGSMESNPQTGETQVVVSGFDQDNVIQSTGKQTITAVEDREIDNSNETYLDFLTLGAHSKN